MYTCLKGHEHKGPSYRIKDVGWFCLDHAEEYDKPKVIGYEPRKL